MNLCERLPETYAAIDRFHNLVFASPVPSDEAIRWVHQQLERACMLVPRTDEAARRWDLVWQRGLRTEPDDTALDENCNLVFLLVLLHESLGGYRPPRLKPKAKDVCDLRAFRMRWDLEVDLGKLPDGRTVFLAEWQPQQWFFSYVEPQVRGWIERVEQAFRKAFAERFLAGVEEPAGGDDVTKRPSNDAKVPAKRPADRTQSGHSRKKVKPRKRKNQALLAHVNKNKSRLAKGVSEIEIVREFCRQKEIPIAKATNLARNLRRYKKTANPDT